jgi:hypothetical protein
MSGTGSPKAGVAKRRREHADSRARGSQGDARVGGNTSSPAQPQVNPGMTSLTSLLVRNDGWLRACPDGDSTLVYLKWKFTGGKWAGHYVMVLVYYWQLDYGLSLLLDKIAAVEEGAKRPTRDTPYNHS